MNDELDNLVAHLKAIPAGTKLTLLTENIFGAHIEKKITTCGEVRQHGYYTPGGGWGLYRTDGEDRECYEILVKPYRKQYSAWVKIGYTIKDYRLGW
ncbi:hypothetical protein IJ21_17770 [Paenibacillus sp. 32O-W]|uniref:hypothetical protein n=1 Tax=Paenibacillus sp. 32O-W TaxID=1695218 RepID=UPI0007230B9D|nr:hypothetical protein [Paenibacillus sp. 32O-W]ALS27178.1 hypothetical protein IJ21_17770 [Paenibacillus sp. 32O-W]